MAKGSVMKGLKCLHDKFTFLHSNDFTWPCKGMEVVMPGSPSVVICSDDY